MTWLFVIPFLTFCLLFLGEATLGHREKTPPHRGWDWVIHLSGFLCQGAIIPWIGYLLATRVLPEWLPNGAGILPIGWWGAFLLNFVVVDFLYYWQHRFFHRVPTLWEWHRCHHTARRVDIWVTSRNTLLMHFLFVYFLFNPLLGYLVTRPEAFFAGAMITASLDLFRHTNLDFSRLPGADRLAPWIGKIFVLPGAHHRHHHKSDNEGNYGANLILWDRWFGTYLEEKASPESDDGKVYGVANAPPPVVQWLYPFARKRRRKSESTQRPGHAS